MVLNGRSLIVTRPLVNCTTTHLRTRSKNVTIPPEINSSDFGFFFGINWQIRIRYSSLRFFLNDSNFWCVQSPTTCNETVHVHVLWPVLHPHNSISNVVIDDSRYHPYLCLNTSVVAKNVKLWWKVKGIFNRTSWKVSDVWIVRKTWFCLLSLSLSLCLCLSLCCVLCCCGARGCGESGGREGGGREGRREGGRRRGETNRTIWATNSLKIAETEQPYQVKRMIGGIGDMSIWIYSNLKMGKDWIVFWWTSEARDDHTWANFW